MYKLKVVIERFEIIVEGKRHQTQSSWAKTINRDVDKELFFFSE